MENIINIPSTVELIVYAKEVTKDGKNFVVYESTDCHKNRVSVAFTRTGKGAPDKTLFPVKLKMINGVDIWADNRKRFPVYRIASYEIIEANVGRKTRGIPIT